MRLLRKQNPFLQAILKEANHYKRQHMLTHANAEQINALSEMMLNLLKNKIPVSPETVNKLVRHKNRLRELSKRSNSVKRPRKHLLRQQGQGFWSSLRDTFQPCLMPEMRTVIRLLQENKELTEKLKDMETSRDEWRRCYWDTYMKNVPDSRLS